MLWISTTVILNKKCLCEHQKYICEPFFFNMWVFLYLYTTITIFVCTEKYFCGESHLYINKYICESFFCVHSLILRPIRRHICRLLYLLLDSVNRKVMLLMLEMGMLHIWARSEQYCTWDFTCESVPILACSTDCLPVTCSCLYPDG